MTFVFGAINKYIYYESSFICQEKKYNFLEINK